jgi:serine phosphatase RsbU (regulator of sigma subunit)
MNTNLQSLIRNLYSLLLLRLRKGFLILSFLCFLQVSSSFAKSYNIDSLLIVLKTCDQDTTLVNTLNSLGKAYEFKDQKLSVQFLKRSLKLADSINFLYGKGAALKYLGYLAEDVSELDSAMYYFQLSYETFVKAKMDVQAADLLKMMGESYKGKGDYSNALNYLQKALRVFEALKSNDGIAGIDYSLGQLYQSMEQNDKAMEYYTKSLEMYKKLNQPVDIGNSLTAVGIMYNFQKDYEKAKFYYNEAKKIYEAQGYDNGLSNLYTWMAITAYNEKDPDAALAYFIQSKDLYEKLNNIPGLIYCYNNIGSIYADKKDYKRAIESEEKSLEMAIKSKSLEYIRYSHEILANTYAKSGDFEKAFEHQFSFMKYKDSILNETSMKQINEMQAKYETEKKDKELLLKDAEISKQTAAAEKQAAQRNYLFIGFALMLLVSIFIFRGYKLKQKANTIIEGQKQEVEKQKELIEVKQKEIVDSINYAKHLQQAILPPLSLVQQFFNDCFILNLPKDIVSGDFYWMHVNGDEAYIAAADCTGHGVPGAMVSVVCSNALDRAVKEFGITEPGKILDKVRELVVLTFEKSESEVKDGMDISLCRINLKSRELAWAGANNPLWLVRSGELKEIKANKQPIGKTDLPLPFTTHTMNAEKGDQLYVFTDGYADQFGGNKGKKFMYRPFKEQLQKISSESPAKQKQFLLEHFQSWRGSLEQVDDVLIIGIKV